jgi:hypothetical protein
MKKSKNILAWLRKMVLAQHNSTVCGAGKGRSNGVHLQKTI